MRIGFDARDRFGEIASVADKRSAEPTLFLNNKTAAALGDEIPAGAACEGVFRRHSVLHSAGCRDSEMRK